MEGKGAGVGTEGFENSPKWELEGQAFISSSQLGIRG